MRKFSSYGPLNAKLHYHAPRTELIEQTCIQLLGEDPNHSGHYITVWAPRQTGKTWLMQQVMARLKAQDDFEVGILTMQSAKEIEDAQRVLRIFVNVLRDWFERDFPAIQTWEELPSLFTAEYFSKPLILIIDEFDAIDDACINHFANEFRTIYTQRSNQINTPSIEKHSRLHGLALIGVRSVLGIENVSGSPFNIQRSVHVPNLTKAEVASMFAEYAAESGQSVDPVIVERLFYETRGQPGLTGWFGELLTEQYNRHESSITPHDFEVAFSAGLNALPNNNILNIISKAKEEPYVDTVYQLFKTEQKTPFSYDDPHLNFLYLNGVIDQTTEDRINFYVRFASPFVQKRLFNYFSRQFFGHLGRLYDPFEELSDTISATSLSIPNLMRRYEQYFHQRREWILKEAPRRESDNRVIEAIFHFNLYTYLAQFLADFDGRVTPEFPTGNGKIDLLITYAEQLFGIEVKSFANRKKYQEALVQAANYGNQLQLDEIWLVFFVEIIDEENREKFERAYRDSQTGVQVQPIFVETGQ